MHRSVKMGPNNDILTTAKYDVRSILAFTAAAGRPGSQDRTVQSSVHRLYTALHALHTRTRPETSKECRHVVDLLTVKLRVLCTAVVRTYPPYLPYLLRRIFATFAMLLSPRNHFLSCRWTNDLEVRDVLPCLCWKAKALLLRGKVRHSAGAGQRFKANIRSRKVWSRARYSRWLHQEPRGDCGQSEESDVNGCQEL